MLKNFAVFLLLASLCGSAAASGHGKEESDQPPVSNISYYELAPEIVTNCASLGNRICYVRLKVQIMVDNPADVELIQYNSPVLRDIVITTVYSKDINTIASPNGQENIIAECKSRMDAFFQEREGRRLIREVLFTNFIFQ